MLLKGTVRSKSLEMDTTLTIIAPRDVTAGAPYKTAYVLHTLGGNSDSFAHNTMLPIFARDYGTIFVLPEVGRSFYTDMRYGNKYFTYVTEELPKIVKNMFNVSDKREDTAVFGASMGGYGALRCALTNPEAYGFCCAISSACLYLKDEINEGRNNIEKFKEYATEKILEDFIAILGDDFQWRDDLEIMNLIRNLSDKPIKPAIYAACGTDDFLRKDNIRFSKDMENYNFNYKYEEWDGVHDWNFFNAALKRGLDLLGEQPSYSLFSAF